MSKNSPLLPRVLLRSAMGGGFSPCQAWFVPRLWPLNRSVWHLYGFYRFQGPEEMGIVSLWPENMRLGLFKPLAWSRASTEVPKRLAIALKVSPTCVV